jgi:hypothetical protein
MFIPVLDLVFIHHGSLIQGSKMHRILDPDPQPCLLHVLLDGYVHVRKS